MNGLQIEHLTVRIPVSPHEIVHAATDVSLTVPAGTVTALVGESGCGKSILAAAVMNMLPAHARSHGSITVTTGGSAVRILPPHDHRANVRGRLTALVPQSPVTSLTPVRTARSQLQETLDVLRSPKTCDELAERVGLNPADLDRYPHELSGGMAQRVVVAAAVAADPVVVVADEPTSQLDRALADHILAVLRALADEGAAVLLITHDLGALLRTGIADTLAVSYASRIMEVGPADDVLDDPWHDYTADLLAALPSRGLRSMPGSPPSLTNLPDDCVYHLRKPSTTFSGGPTHLVTLGSRTVRTRRDRREL